MGAFFRSAPGLVPRLSRLLDIPLDRLHLVDPTLLVASISFSAAPPRNALEARLHNCKQRPLGDVLKLKNDQSRRLSRVIDLQIDRVAVPSPGKDPLRLHSLDRDFERDMLVALVCNLSSEASPWRERPCQIDARTTGRRTRRSPRLARRASEVPGEQFSSQFDRRSKHKLRCILSWWEEKRN